MRIASACVNCRVSKRRCATLEGQATCYHCQRQNIPCSLAKTLGPESFEPPPKIVTGRVQSKIDAFVDHFGEPTVHGMVELYLSLIHDRPHSIFHIPTLWNEIQDRSIPPALLLSICATGCRLSPDENVRTLSASITAQAKAEIHLEIENICLSTIQAYILIANIFAAELEPSLETLYFGMATRMAQILGLDRADHKRNAVEQELSSRVWYSLVLADNFCSPGLGISRQLSVQGSIRQVPLPADEIWFQGLKPGNTAGPSSSPSSGLWTYNLQLVQILGSILDLNHRLAEGVEDENAELDVHDLDKRMNEWQQSLPVEVQENAENLGTHRVRGTGGVFVALHLGYHHYSTLLFFRYLNSDLVNPQSTEYARRCRFHASSLSHLLRTSRESPGSEAVYATVGHMAVVSSSVLLHILLFGNSTELEQARTDLTSNFAALLELRKYWPCLEHTIGRLLTFQDFCLRDKLGYTHQVDSWMIRFLIEHSVKLDERTASSQNKPDHTALDTPASDAPISDAREWTAMQALSSLWHFNDAVTP